MVILVNKNENKMDKSNFQKAMLTAFHKKCELDKCIEKIMDNKKSIRYYQDKIDATFSLFIRAKGMTKNGEHKYKTYMCTILRDIKEAKLILKGLATEQHEHKKLRCKLEKEYAAAVAKREYYRNN